MERKIVAYLISGFIVVIMMFLFVLEKKDFSEEENRYLQDFPELSFDNLFSGDLTSDLEEYSADHFPFRLQFLMTKTYSEIALGKTENNDVYLASDQYLFDKFNNVDTDRLNEVKEVLNSFYLKHSDIDFTTMIVPNSIAINSERMPVFASYIDQSSVLEFFYNDLNSTNINITEVLDKQNDHQQVYYRLDHHWTTDGAFMAYQEYLKANDFVFDDIYQREVVSEDFVGTMASKANVYFYQSDQIVKYNYVGNFQVEYNDGTNNIMSDSFYVESYLATKDKYSYFLNANQPLVTIENLDNDSGQNLLVIKDSFANSFIPFVANNYDNVVVVDLRYYNMTLDDLINKYKITDGLVLYNLSNILVDDGIVKLN